MGIGNKTTAFKDIWESFFGRPGDVAATPKRARTTRSKHIRAIRRHKRAQRKSTR